MSSVIVDTGAFIPEDVQTNVRFSADALFESTCLPRPSSVEVIIDKFNKITGISERRNAPPNMDVSYVSAKTSKKATAGGIIAPKTLDQIIVAHNFGEITYDSIRSRNMSSIGCGIKHLLGMKHGVHRLRYTNWLPAWLHSLIQAHASSLTYRR